MEVKVNGFSHKMPLLLEQLVQALVALKVRSTTLCVLLASGHASLSASCLSCLWR